MTVDGVRLLPLLLASVIFLAEIEFIRCHRISVLSSASEAVDESAIRDCAAKLLADLYGFDLLWKDKYSSTHGEKVIFPRNVLHKALEDAQSNEAMDEEKRFSEFLGGKRARLSDSSAGARRLSASAAAVDDVDDSMAPRTPPEADNRKRYPGFIQNYKRFSEFLGGK